MKINHTFRARNASARGFSLIELLIVLLILGIVMGSIYTQIATVQQRSRAEQVKLDDFQQARDFVDQFFRDINQIGYPNARMMDTTSWTPIAQVPLRNDHRIAVGLVKADATEIRFEGDTAGNGNVQSIVYMINGSGTCPLCLQRSQANKADGNSLTGQTQNWGTEVNDLVTTSIFSYFDTNGNAVSVPVDISSNPTAIASIKTIQIKLRITNPNVVDPKTRQAIEVSFQGEVSVNNCSLAANGQGSSCF